MAWSQLSILEVCLSDVQFSYSVKTDGQVHIAQLSDNRWTIRGTERAPKTLDQKTGSSKEKMERGPHQTVWTHMVKISQAQTPVGWGVLCQK